MICADWFASWRLASAQAERDEARAALARLVAFIDKHGGYMSDPYQSDLRRAKRLLGGVG